MRPQVYTVEAVRAALHRDNDQVQEVVTAFLEGLDPNDANEMMDAAGTLLRDSYNFAAALTVSLTRGDEKLSEVVLDSYAMDAMVDDEP